LIDLPTHISNYGALIVLEGGTATPFSIERVYYIIGVPSSGTRGDHAHRRCHELLIAIAGAFTVAVESVDGSRREYRLDNSSVGLYVPPLYWRILTDFSDKSSVLVLASERYDPEEYIYDRREWRQI
jgi:dTDP-4-dehydrorhamnose 3,5-epimerase-like enzyme